MPSHFPEIRAAEQNHLDYMFFDCIKFIHKVIRHRAELPKTKKKKIVNPGLQSTEGFMAFCFVIIFKTQLP